MNVEPKLYLPHEIKAMSLHELRGALPRALAAFNLVRNELPKRTEVQGIYTHYIPEAASYHAITDEIVREANRDNPPQNTWHPSAQADERLLHPSL